jgi:2C-methyl-D-erythritol 2,4-cyclodiphosphate synthase
MEENIAKLLGTTSGIINVKATTMEKKGIIGTKEGIAAEAYVLIRKGYY